MSEEIVKIEDFLVAQIEACGAPLDKVAAALLNLGISIVVQLTEDSPKNKGIFLKLMALEYDRRREGWKRFEKSGEK